MLRRVILSTILATNIMSFGSETFASTPTQDNKPLISSLIMYGIATTAGAASFLLCTGEMIMLSRQTNSPNPTTSIKNTGGTESTISNYISPTTVLQLFTSLALVLYYGGKWWKQKPLGNSS